MCANRLLDMRLDALNPRTAGRALPGGRVSVGLYVGVMGAAAVLFHAACAGFYFLLKNPWPVMWSVPVLAFVCLYPLLKRFTRWCHFYLGIALALAPVCACLAVAGEVKSFAWVMAGAVWLWTSGFDILYATQDVESDRLTGVFSVPAALGVPAALWVARVCHGVSALLLLSLPAFESQLALLYVLGAVAAVVLLIAQHLMVKPNDLSRINLAFFTLNGAVSLVLGGLGIADLKTDWFFQLAPSSAAGAMM
jgi:4-hydroxybenzoate polyprenyltransferase